MLQANLSQYLIKFTERLEENEIVSSESAGKIRKYVRAKESPSHWILFLVISSMLGAITFAAGVFAITSHNWYEFPVWLRGVLGFVPLLVALYFYYRMLTKHPNSAAWIESSSLFLMLMIGASIAITSQTYHMGGDYEDFLLTMLLVTVPLFYIKRASGITFFYFLFATFYLFLDVRVSFRSESLVDFGSNSIWYWIFILAFLPHYYMSLARSKKEQGTRFMFLTILLYFTVNIALLASIDSNRLLWSVVYNVGFYLLAKRFMGGHYWFWSRIMSWMPQLFIAITLLFISNRFFMMSAFRFDSIFNMDDWTGGQWYYFLLLVVVMAGIYYNYFKSREKFEDTNQLILFAPGLIIFLMIVDYFIDTWWVLSIIVNLYILCLAVVVMVNGSEHGKFYKIIGGLILYAVLVIVRYFDTDMGFIWKGLLFMSFGAVFFMITMFMKEKVDQVSRNKKRIDGK
ncbi:MAG: hypothetical protein Crog4KO_22400 [Crocinitomicaceae bacterium]